LRASQNPRVSSSAYDQIRGKIAIEFTDLGEQSLKNIARPCSSVCRCRGWARPGRVGAKAYPGAKSFHGGDRADLAEARTRDDGLKLRRCAGSHKGRRAVDYFFGHLHMVVSDHPFPGSVLFFEAGRFFPRHCLFYRKVSTPPCHFRDPSVGERPWQTLNGRPIESLIDLPLMTDPEQQAAMQVLSTLLGPAYFTDPHLLCLLACRMVNVGMQHGMCGASAHAYGFWGIVLGPVFHHYREGYRSAKLACDLVEKHGFIDYRAKAYRSMGIAALWTEPITTALDFNQVAVRAASETSCFGSRPRISICLTTLTIPR
jgi:hypothetical protein